VGVSLTALTDAMVEREGLTDFADVARRTGVNITDRGHGTGQPLDGGTPHHWRAPSGGAPVDAFWFLTMYEVTPKGRYFFTANPIGRCSNVDGTPGLVVDPKVV
jgi:hypothetical protein